METIKLAKTKTSIKHKESSKNIRNKALLIPHDPVKEVLNGELFGKAILECLQNNDPEGVMEVIAIYLEAINKSEFSKEKEVHRQTLYSALKHRNPTIKTLAKLMHNSVH